MSAPRWLDGEGLTRPLGVAEDAVVRVLRVPPEAAGRRLDVFLSESLRSTSRTRAKLIAERSAFCPLGRPRKASDRLQAEDRVVLWRRPVDDVIPDIELRLVYSDSHLLVIDKPPNITVHPTARHYNATVTKVLERSYPDEKLHLIHRLDKETSGVLLVARGRAADRAFKMLFEGLTPSPHRGAAPQLPRVPRGTVPPPSAPEIRTRRVDKTYLAICWGSPDDGLIDTPLEADTDNPLRVKMRVAPAGTGLHAATRVKTLARCEGYSLVRCHLLTGRQHQIRVHLASIGCPVVGDKLYGPDDRLLARAADGELTKQDLALLELPRHALHATSYELEHAITGEPLRLVSPLPPDLVEFWKSVSGYEPPAA